MTSVLGYSLLVLGTLACGQIGAADLSSLELQTGKKLYTVKCAKCHKFYDPASYTQPEWDKWMEKMSKKSRLNAEQRQLLSRYLETFRENKRKAELPGGQAPE